MKRLHFLSASLAICALAALALVLPPANAIERPALSTYAACRFHAPMQLVDKQDLRNGSGWRTVKTEAGERRVSVLEGLRLMLAGEAGANFVNLKIERSAAGQFAQDRDTILAQMQMLANGGEVKMSRQDGFEMMALDRESLETNILGIATLFDPQRDLVVTAYFLNAPPAQRAFQTMEGYAVMRDQVLADVRACLGPSL